MDFLNSHKTLESFMNQLFSDSEDLGGPDESSKYKEDFLSEDPISELLAKDRFYKKMEDGASGEIDYERLNKQLDCTGSENQGCPEREDGGTTSGRLINEIDWNNLGRLGESGRNSDDVKLKSFEDFSQSTRFGGGNRKFQSLMNPETTTYSALQQEYRGVQRLEYSKEISEDKHVSAKKEDDPKFGLKLFQIEETDKTQLRDMDEIMADLENFGGSGGPGHEECPELREKGKEEEGVARISPPRLMFEAQSVGGDVKEDLAGRLRILSKEMETQEQIIREYQQDNVGLRERLKTQQVEMQVQQKSQRSQIDQLNRNISQLKSELEVRPAMDSTGYELVIRENSKLREEIAEVVRARGESDQKCQQLEESLRESREANAGLNQSNLASLKKVAQVEQEKMSLEKCLSEEQTRTAQLEAKVEQKAKQVAAVSKKLGDANGSISGLRREIRVLEEEAGQRRKVGEKARRGQNWGNVGRLFSNVKNMREGLGGMRSYAESLRVEIGIMERSVVGGSSCKNLREIHGHLSWRLNKLIHLVSQCESEMSQNGVPQPAEKCVNSEKITTALDNIKNSQDKVLEQLGGKEESGTERSVVESQQATIELLQRRVVELEGTQREVAGLRESERRLQREVERAQTALLNARRTQDPVSREFESLMARVEQLKAQYEQAVGELRRLASELAEGSDSGMAALLEERDGKIRHLRNHLAQIEDILQYLADRGVAIPIPPQFKDYLTP